MKKCTLTWFWVFLLACLAWAEPLVLVVGDLNQVQVTLVESKLRQRLRTLRDEGKLEARLASYNWALADHRSSLQQLGLNGQSLPLLVVCQQANDGKPTVVEWSTVVLDPEVAVADMMQFLNPDAVDPILPGADLMVYQPTISVGSMLGVINIKVRCQNLGQTTLTGPLRIEIWTRRPGGEWQKSGEKSQDKLPSGWSTTKDFFLEDTAHLLDGVFEVKAKVYRGPDFLQEQSATYSPAAAP